MRDSLRARNIFVMLTNRCNLRCSYCYESGKNNRSSNAQVIQSYLTVEFEPKQFDEYFLVFHGGEPFLDFNLMKDIAQWCWNTYPDLNIRCMTTTNGTCLDASMKAWLLDNRHRFVAILSLDGGRDTHNRNRCNSFDLIDRDFFASTWPYQPVKMTVSPDSVGALYTDFLEIKSYGFIPNPSLAKEVSWSLHDHLPIFVGELNKMVDYYLEHADDIPCELVGIDPALFTQEAPLPHNRACGAGVNNIAYDIEGYPFPCHTFITDLKQAAPDTTSLFEDLATKDGPGLAPACAGCLIYPACEPCYGLNYSKRGNMGAIDTVMCEFTKARVKASIRLYGEMIASGKQYARLKNISQSKLNDMVSGILYCAKTICHEDIN